MPRKERRGETPPGQLSWLFPRKLREEESGGGHQDERAIPGGVLLPIPFFDPGPAGSSR